MWCLKYQTELFNGKKKIYIYILKQLINIVQFGALKHSSQIFQLHMKAFHYIQENKFESQKKSSVQSVLS